MLDSSAPVLSLPKSASLSCLCQHSCRAYSNDDVDSRSSSPRAHGHGFHASHTVEDLTSSNKPLFYGQAQQGISRDLMAGSIVLYRIAIKADILCLQLLLLWCLDGVMKAWS